MINIVWNQMMAHLQKLCKEDILETDGRLILRFEKVVPGKKYSLTCIRKGESEGWKMFRNLGFPELTTKINGRS